MKRIHGEHGELISMLVLIMAIAALIFFVSMVVEEYGQRRDMCANLGLVWDKHEDICYKGVNCTEKPWDDTCSLAKTKEDAIE